MKIEERGVGGR